MDMNAVLRRISLVINLKRLNEYIRDKVNYWESAEPAGHLPSRSKESKALIRVKQHLIYPQPPRKEPKRQPIAPAMNHLPQHQPQFRHMNEFNAFP